MEGLKQPKKIFSLLLWWFIAFSSLAQTPTELFRFKSRHATQAVAVDRFQKNVLYGIHRGNREVIAVRLE